MLLIDQESGKLVEVLGTKDLVNPMQRRIVGRLHYGEEPQDPDYFQKDGLCFTSGEALPRCWTDSHYRDAELEALQRRDMA
jgi:hypothetical protein